MITVNNSFSLKLKELRQKNNLTQDRLADELNARYHLNESKATISQFEHNKRIPDLDRLINIADYFQVSLDYLCCNKSNDNVRCTNPGTRIKRLIKKNGLSQKEFVDKFNEKYGYSDSEATISQYVNNKRTPEIDKMVKIADFFNVTLDYIMCRTDIDSDMSIYDKSKKNISFSTPQEAVSFILSQKVIADLGGYSLDSISNTEIMEMTNDIIDIFCIISRKHK
ncbi:helix-turn-helix domain-containing protein [Faecalibacillus intestinalis]|jgi:transcriptional regulator with XRE-family HTH domain|uniref:helix-turn-helix domain-containing protein n=1 Tax=Faecalibacillus intestinalis TaxID=1982626 RepID=UPI0022E55255|nr:helix-turn-helix transcriptional regulator [Faecalibacillus intestinalis]